MTCVHAGGARFNNQCPKSLHLSPTIVATMIGKTILFGKDSSFGINDHFSSSIFTKSLCCKSEVKPWKSHCYSTLFMIQPNGAGLSTLKNKSGIACYVARPSVSSVLPSLIPQCRRRGTHAYSYIGKEDGGRMARGSFVTCVLY